MINNNTHDQLEKSLAELDIETYIDAHLQAHGQYHPSPESWQDQYLYFLMLDRFSDGNEQATIPHSSGPPSEFFRDNAGLPMAGGTTPPFDFSTDAYTANRVTWEQAGGGWCGGTLKGLRSKLGYLKRLGITTIWISPVFKQVQQTFDLKELRSTATNSYHGYGIQNFLDVDPAFGTRQDLKDLVAEAHQLGIYVLLDIILNHSGDVFQYNANRYFKEKDKNGGTVMDPRWDSGLYDGLGYRDPSGVASLPFRSVDLQVHPGAWPDAAIWPAELQDPQTFSRLGRITNWDYEPEFLSGDFESLKDIDQGHHDLTPDGSKDIGSFHPTTALKNLLDIYKFWIAFADIDGYRVDTVKHMEIGATRLFASAIHEFAQRLGKERFFLLGEITGGRTRAFNTLSLTGLDAAIGIDDVADKLEYLPKGYREPTAYFNLFRNSWEVGQDSHVWLGQHLVTMFDDHDKVGRTKRRYCGDKENRGYRLLIPALALNLTTLGIPCIYYGSEQGFDGDENAGKTHGDRLLRECMFGGPFGSLQSIDRHFFNENHEVYQTIASIIAFAKSKIELRRGRQYLRQISANGNDFGIPHMIGGQLRSVVAWSRIFDTSEVLLAINTDPDHALSVWVTLDDGLHSSGDKLRCLHSTDSSMMHQTLSIEPRNGKAARITVPPAGFVAYQ